MKTKLSDTQLLKCQEVEIHYRRPLFDEMIRIKGHEDVDQTLRKYIDLNKIDLKEFFWVMLLTNSNSVLGISEIGIGCIKGVVTKIHEIFQLVILSNASALIVAHNHPSGKLVASKNDIEVTKKIKKLSKLLSVEFLDHLIITSEGYLSLAQEHLL